MPRSNSIGFIHLARNLIKAKCRGCLFFFRLRWGRTSDSTNERAQDMTRLATCQATFFRGRDLSHKKHRDHPLFGIQFSAVDKRITWPIMTTELPDVRRCSSPAVLLSIGRHAGCEYFGRVLYSLCGALRLCVKRFLKTEFSSREDAMFAKKSRTVEQCQYILLALRLRQPVLQ